MLRLLTYLSAVPFIRHRLYRWLRKDIEVGFSRGNTIIVFFAEDYLLRDHDAISDTIASWNPHWEVGFMTVDTGNGAMTVFFVGLTFQDLWDGVSLYKNALQSAWLKFHVENYMRLLKYEAQQRNLDFDAHEIVP